MKSFLMFVVLATQALGGEVWKVEHSATLRKNAPGTPQYADTVFSSKAECERGIDAALGGQKNTKMRSNYKCFLAGSSADGDAPPDAEKAAAPEKKLNPQAKLGAAIVNRLLTPEQTGHNIVGENNFEEFGGKKPDALGRDQDAFGFIASVPEETAPAVKAHQLPNKNAEKVCGKMKQLSCYSTRGFIGCCPKGFSYVAAPAGMAPMGDVCGTDAADKQGWRCQCYKDNEVCITSKQGMCYGCSE
jgi:hypothetical protein